jgi:hypothetical protein
MREKPIPKKKAKRYAVRPATKTRDGKQRIPKHKCMLLPREEEIRFSGIGIGLLATAAA